MKKSVNVAITSDLTCPWCWVGLKKLQQASNETGINVNIEWKPYLLRPATPEEGAPKGGTPASRVGAYLKQAGEEVGINFTGLTDRTPNTILFHAVMKILQEDDEIDCSVVTEFQEAVFECYYTLGIFPDQKGILAGARKTNNSDLVHKISTFFDDPVLVNKFSMKVVKEASETSEHGVRGVPSFEFNGKREFSGAQPVETFIHFLAQNAE